MPYAGNMARVWAQNGGVRAGESVEQVGGTFAAHSGRALSRANRNAPRAFAWVRRQCTGSHLHTPSFQSSHILQYSTRRASAFDSRGGSRCAPFSRKRRSRPAAAHAVKSKSRVSDVASLDQRNYRVAASLPKCKTGPRRRDKVGRIMLRWAYLESETTGRPARSHPPTVAPGAVPSRLCELPQLETARNEIRLAAEVGAERDGDWQERMRDQS